MLRSFTVTWIHIITYRRRFFVGLNYKVPSYVDLYNNTILTVITLVEIGVGNLIFH